MTAHGPGTINQTIVVVDDDASYLALIHEFLSEEGYARVVCVPSDDVEKTIRREQPGLVLMDMHAAWPASAMQRLDRLLHDPLTAAIPIIICTTDARLVMAQAATHILTLGCEILEKPFQLEDLLTRVQARIGPPKRPETMDTTQIIPL